jgi:hypothetical protein
MKTTVAQLIAGIMLLAYGLTGHAEVYRCVDTEGHVIFTQHPCGPAQQGEKVNLDGADINRKPKAEVCKEVEKLANLLFPHINETDSILDVYTDLGGRGDLSAGITAAVNYVFNFRYNPKARQSDVVALTHAKCLDGGFGRITEKDLPDWGKIKYIKEKPKEQAQTKQSREEQAKTCRQYDEKLAHLQERLTKAKDKSEKLQIQVDKEYYEGLKKEQCKAANQKPGDKAKVSN